MTAEDFIKKIFSNDDYENKKQSEDSHFVDPALNTPLHYEELEV